MVYYDNLRNAKTNRTIVMNNLEQYNCTVGANGDA